MPAHVHREPQQQVDRPTAAAEPSEPTMPDPAVERIAADVRIAAVTRMQTMSVLHAQAAWERRRRDPLAPYGLAFLYVQRDHPTRYGLYAATKLWLAGQESANLPRLLLSLSLAVDEHRADPNFDLRTQWANRHDEGMTSGAMFVGIGVSSLDTPSGTWEKVQAYATNPADIPASLRIVLSGDAIIVCERRGLNELNELTVRSTHALTTAHGYAAIPFGYVGESQLLGDPYHAQAVGQMIALCDRLWHQDQGRLARLGSRRVGGPS